MNYDAYMAVITITIIILVGVISWAVLVNLTEGVDVELNGWTMAKSDILEGDMRDFVILAQRYAQNHEYNATGFNCINYTDELADIMDKLGFKYTKMIGCADGAGNASRCHEWLRLMVDFEPQSGKFTDYSKEYPRQHEVDE